MAISRYFPRRLSFSKICNILIAYLNAGAEREHIGLNDVASKSSVELHNISRNNNFLKSWGFIEESEKEPGKYKLTREAAEFASAYRISPEGDHTKQILRQLISKDEIIAKFVEHIEGEGIDRNALLVDLPRIIGDLRADKVGINSFVDMLGYAFQIERLHGGGESIRPTEKPRATKYVQRGAKKRIQAPRLVLGPQAGLSITLSISPEISPERLKEYITAVLKAYEEYGKEE